MIQFRSLPGITPYETARALQLELVDARVRGEIPDTVLLLEHAPVITRGRGLQIRTGKSKHENESARAMPLVPALLPPGIEYAEVERGGDLTYHGPGQLVVYPICKLDGTTPLTREHDLSHFLRTLEQITIDVLAPELQPLGYSLARVEDATGVWLEREGRRTKIASLGIAVRRWVTFHGLAVNLVNDLKPFALMSPCGFSPEVMTSWAECVGRDAALERQTSGQIVGQTGAWRDRFEARFRECFLALG